MKKKASTNEEKWWIGKDGECPACGETFTITKDDEPREKPTGEIARFDCPDCPGIIKVKRE